MSSSNLNQVVCRIPPVTGANGSHSKLSNVNMINKRSHSLPTLQVKETEKPLLQESFTSRRDMMRLTAASVGLLSLLLPVSSAEARPRNTTMRQKIMEKLQMLREKAGLGKPKDETEEDKKPKPESGEAAKKPIIKEEILVPALPNILHGKTVETTLLP